VWTFFRSCAAKRRARLTKHLFWKLNGQYAVRRGPWKLVFFAQKEKTPELYDLSADPSEARNLAAKESGRVAELRRAREDWNSSLPSAILPKKKD
jgi:arylsulfatase A-like enzyme